MKIEDTEISQRLKEFVKENGGNVSAIARDCDLTIGHLGDIIRGAKRISASVLRALAEKKDLNPTWLFTGAGNMFLGSKSSMPDKTAESANLIENNRLKDEITGLLREKVQHLEQELGKQTQSHQEMDHQFRRKLSKYESKLKGLMKELGYSDEKILGFINDDISLTSLLDDARQTRQVKRLGKKSERA
ncbi:MAG: helix-turn-helix transcriptional regulator [SAR324 cluster bacterium]|nr:helix-turn-helix transcriptional regulator [SAR324 cluster bacterium]